MRPLFELLSGPLLKLGLGPLARYGTYQETISGRPEQKYLSSDPRLEWFTNCSTRNFITWDLYMANLL